MSFLLDKFNDESLLNHLKIIDILSADLKFYEGLKMAVLAKFG